MGTKALHLRKLFKTQSAALLLFFFVFFFVFFPSSSFAFLGAIGNAFGSVIGKAVAAIILGVLSGIMAVAAIILEWATDPSFIRHPYTCLTIDCQPGGDPTIVGIAWPVVRDLANMFLVLALIAIAMGTALRIEEYHARKALRLFVFIAILINFTPVILGIIVDGANIAMRFFLEGFSGGNIMANIFIDQVNSIGGTLNLFDPESWFSWFFKLLFMAVWIILASVIFLLFAVLFIMRRVAIWILVILSPLAFVAYILPITRRYFSAWWHQFMQWTVIGISAGFFLWLSEHIINFAGQGGKFVSKAGGPAGQFEQLINAVLPYGIAILFLGFGFFMALQTSAIGASSVVGSFQKGTRKAGVWAKQGGQKRMAEWGRKRTMEAAGAEKRTERTTLFGKPIPGTGAAKAVAWHATAPVRFGARRLKPYALEAEIRSMHTETAEAKKIITAERKLVAFRAPASTRAQRTGVLLAAIEQKQLGMLKKLGLKDEEIEQVIRHAATASPQEAGKIVRSVPHMADNIMSKLPTAQHQALGLTFIDDRERDKYSGSISRKLFATAAPKDIENWTPDVWMDPNSQDFRTHVKEAITEHWRGAQLGSAGRTLGSQFVDKFMEHANSLGHAWFEENNKQLLNYLKTNPAQELGFTELGGGGTPRPTTTTVSPAPPPGWTGRPSGPVVPQDTGIGSRETRRPSSPTVPPPPSPPDTGAESRRTRLIPPERSQATTPPPNTEPPPDTGRGSKRKKP